MVKKEVNLKISIFKKILCFLTVIIALIIMGKIVSADSWGNLGEIAPGVAANDFVDYNNILYASTSSGPGNARIYSYNSSSGNWTLIYTDYDLEGATDRSVFLYRLIVYNGKLYATQGNGGRIIEITDSNSNGIFESSDIIIISHEGVFPDTFGEFAIHNNVLYSGFACCGATRRVWIFNGATWSPDLNSPKYSDDNEWGAELIDFKGNLYLGTQRIYKYNDLDSSWNSVFGPANRTIPTNPVPDGCNIATGVCPGCYISGSNNICQMRITRLIEYDGKLFAITDNQGMSLGSVWYSDTGNPGSWIEFTNVGTGTDPGDGINLSIAPWGRLQAVGVYNGKLYVASGWYRHPDNLFSLEMDGGRLYEYDGINWKLIENGFGGSNFADLESYNGKFYASAGGNIYITPISNLDQIAYWADENGNKINNASIVVGITPVSLILEDPSLLEGSPVVFEIHEKITSNIVRTINGVMGGNLTSKVNWIINSSDLSGLPVTDNLEFYFLVSETIRSNDLNVTILSDDFCSVISICDDYNETYCEADICLVSDLVNGACGTSVNNTNNCSIRTNCNCYWDNSDNSCKSIMEYQGCEFDGSCIQTGILSGNCSLSGFLYYNLTGVWDWGTNDYASVNSSIDPVMSRWITDGLRWHYDPNNFSIDCITPEDQIFVSCSAQLELPFFNMYNFFVTIILFVFVYIFISFRKNKN